MQTGIDCQESRPIIADRYNHTAVLDREASSSPLYRSYSQCQKEIADYTYIMNDNDKSINFLDLKIESLEDELKRAKKIESLEDDLKRVKMIRTLSLETKAHLQKEIKSRYSKLVCYEKALTTCKFAGDCDSSCPWFHPAKELKVLQVKWAKDKEQELEQARLSREESSRIKDVNFYLSRYVELGKEIKGSLPDVPDELCAIIRDYCCANIISRFYDVSARDMKDNTENRVCCNCNTTFTKHHEYKVIVEANKGVHLSYIIVCAKCAVKYGFRTIDCENYIKSDLKDKEVRISDEITWHLYDTYKVG